VDERPVHLTVQLPSGSSMFPSWLVFVFVGAFVVASVALLLVWQTNRDLAAKMQETSKELAREIRILQVHAQDLENVTIRDGIATRADFVGWEEGTPKATQSPNGIGVRPYRAKGE
jgi:hypothetical protein